MALITIYRHCYIIKATFPARWLRFKPVSAFRGFLVNKSVKIT